MARKKQTQTTTTNPKTVDVTYTISELTEAAELVFATSPDVVRAALTMNGIKETSLPQAQKLVKAYAKKEVK